MSHVDGQCPTDSGSNYQTGSKMASDPLTRCPITKLAANIQTRLIVFQGKLPKLFLLAIDRTLAGNLPIYLLHLGSYTIAVADNASVIKKKQSLTLLMTIMD